MIAAKPAENEAERLKKLKQLEILDTLEEQAYDDLTFLAAQICGVPIALVSLIDETRQWFKSHHGLDATETPREFAFCAHAILQDDLFVVENADDDIRFKDNPLVVDEPKVKFYAGAPLVLDNQYHIGTLCVIDHHARKLDDQQQKALNALARQVVSQLELRIKVKQLLSLDHAKDEFLSMVSHELRTPLTSIKGSLGLLNHFSTDMNEQARNLLDVALNNSNQLLIIVNDILDLAKMEAGRLQIDLHKINLLYLLQRAVELNQNYISQCKCNVEIKLPAGVDEVWVKADEQRILQVLSNLLSNAAKFSPEGGKIEVFLELNNHVATVSVVDYGAGIAHDFQQQLFKKFRQSNGSAGNKLPGTGLGLNICKHIIESHHGEIGFESTPGERTAFYFRLKTLS